MLKLIATLSLYVLNLSAMSLNNFGNMLNSKIHVDDQVKDLEFNTTMGFVLVAAGALVPALAACLLYLEDLIRLFPNTKSDFNITKSRSFLSSILGFSVGVLLCSIFIALLPEAMDSFEDSQWLEHLPSSRSKRLIGCAIFTLFVLILISKRFFFGSHEHSPANQIEASGEVHKEFDGSEGTQVGEGNNSDFKVIGHRLVIAFFIHNIPEGLVTFLSVFESYKFGIVFTIALSLHRFPEGIMVAVPIYYGYQSKWKAIVACLICTWIPQMIGALIGWASTKLIYDSLITGVMFLIATTILSHTTFNHVIPLVRTYDPKDTYTSSWILIGIVLFLFIRTAIE